MKRSGRRVEKRNAGIAALSFGVPVLGLEQLAREQRTVAQVALKQSAATKSLAQAIRKAEGRHVRTLRRIMSPSVQKEFEARKASWRRKLEKAAGDKTGAAVERRLEEIREQARTDLASYLAGKRVDARRLRQAITDRVKAIARAGQIRAI